MHADRSFQRGQRRTTEKGRSPLGKGVVKSTGAARRPGGGRGKHVNREEDLATLNAAFVEAHYVGKASGAAVSKEPRAKMGAPVLAHLGDIPLRSAPPSTRRRRAVSAAELDESISMIDALFR